MARRATFRVRLAELAAPLAFGQELDGTPVTLKAAPEPGTFLTLGAALVLPGLAIARKR